jgi:inosose dehydratase
MKSRRNFLKLTAAGLAATSLGPLRASESPANSAAPSKNIFSLGMAGYTFREFTVEQTIAMMQRVNVQNISLKDFHLPQTSTQAEVDAVLNKFRAAGISVYTAGVIYMTNAAEVDRAFDYIHKMGLKLMVGAPAYDQLSYVEQKLKENDVRIAIHNHGPDNPLFPNATDIWNHIQNMDPRMGICIDIGHTTRDKQDLNADLVKYSSRIFDIHIKDVSQASKEGTTIEMGRGIIDIPGFVRTLQKINYSGMCSLEFEKDMKDSLPGIAESLGYFRGVCAALA